MDPVYTPSAVRLPATICNCSSGTSAGSGAKVLSWNMISAEFSPGRAKTSAMSDPHALRPSHQQSQRVLSAKAYLSLRPQALLRSSLPLRNPLIQRRSDLIRLKGQIEKNKVVNASKCFGILPLKPGCVGARSQIFQLTGLQTAFVLLVPPAVEQ